MITYQGALRRLQPIIGPVCQALRAGLDEAVRYHAHNGFNRDDDPHFFAHMTRRVAWQRLREQGLQVELGEESGQMSSLLIPYGGILLWILRGDRGRQISSKPRALYVPGLGQSEPRRRFWFQESHPTFPGLEAENLLWVWGDDDGVLTEPMILARPTGGIAGGRLAQLSWKGPISERMACMHAEDLDGLKPDPAEDELWNEDAG